MAVLLGAGNQDPVIPLFEVVCNVNEPPELIAGIGLKVGMTFGVTVTVTLLLPMQAAAVVPLTVYMVVELGVTVMGLPLTLPGFHTYVVPTTLLVADKLEKVSAHITEGVAVGVTTGLGLTKIVSQPNRYCLMRQYLLLCKW